ncbi:MAG: methyltransferase domain-containing protein [Actinomycetota bacterium]|nr:methyltransferase domain-containing protein [Actinomycetota bacterium]
MIEDLVEETVAVRGREVRLLRPRDSEALLDEDAFEHEEYLPYWAELWPSALALADAVAARALRGARTLELGCGLGLPSVAAALAGGRALATDWSTDALAFVRRNAERNGVRVETERCAWAQAEGLVARGPWDLVLASDVLYERRNVDELLALLPELVGQRGEVWLTDPGRAPSEAFLAGADERFERRSDRRAGSASVTLHRLRARR